MLISSCARSQSTGCLRQWSGGLSPKKWPDLRVSILNPSHFLTFFSTDPCFLVTQYDKNDVYGKDFTSMSKKEVRYIVVFCCLKGLDNWSVWVQKIIPAEKPGGHVFVTVV